MELGLPCLARCPNSKREENKRHLRGSLCVLLGETDTRVFFLFSGVPCPAWHDQVSLAPFGMGDVGKKDKFI